MLARLTCLTGTLVLTTQLSAQQLSAELDADPRPLSQLPVSAEPYDLYPVTPLVVAGLQEPAEPAVKWSSNLTLGANASFGNTQRRAANAAADAERRSEKHRTTFKLSWDFAEDKDDATKTWDLTQRRTKGGVKHDYFISGKKTFLFLANDAEYDYDQDIALRFTSMAGVGHQLIDEKDLKFALEAGAGYYREDSRITGAPRKEYPSARLGWALDWDIQEGIKLLNDLQVYPSLDEADDVSGSMDTRLQMTIRKGMFAQLQWIIDYDNTPALDAMGNPNDRMDHRVLLSVGWKF